MSEDATTPNASRSRRYREDPRSVVCRRLASEVIAFWRAGATPDARALLEKHPELRRFKSLVVDLAYEEYCLRTASGESVAPSRFCEKFPTFQKSLQRRIQIHLLMDHEPELLAAVSMGPWPAPGDELLGYDIIEELGRGAFGRVYLASERALGRRLVAVKVCRHGAEEADTLGKLQHANIVPVYSVRQEDELGWTVICMPYRARATLCDVLDAVAAAGQRPDRASAILDAVSMVNDDGGPGGRGRSASSRSLRGSYVSGVLHIVRQLASALAYAHSQGVYHLDLKPSNVLIGNDGAPLLLDFNLSYDRHKANQRMGGTLPYMAPEQLRGFLGQPDRPAIGARSDIFALGVILYELLYGKLPFGAAWEPLQPREAASELLTRQQTGLRLPPDAVVGAAVAGIVERCLAFDPRARFQSAAELAAAIGKELSRPRRIRRWAEAHRWAAGAALGLALAALIATVVFFAVRDPYSVRLLRQGVAAFQQGDYQEALTRLDRSLQADPSSAPALFARGQTYVELADHVSAIRDLKQAANLAPNPEILALLGYCCSKSRYHRDAIGWYRRAIENGLDDTAIYNNLGFSYLQLGQHRAASDVLRRAIELGPNVRAPLHTLARAEFWIAQQDQQFPKEAMALIQRAIAAGQPTAELYRDAALIAALATKFDAQYEATAVEYLKQAINSGVSTDSLYAYPSFPPLFRQHPELLRQVQTSSAEPDRSPVLLLHPLKQSPR